MAQDIPGLPKGNCVVSSFVSRRPLCLWEGGDAIHPCLTLRSLRLQLVPVLTKEFTQLGAWTVAL